MNSVVRYEQLQRRSMRSVLRHGVLSGLAAGAQGLALQRRLLRRPRIQFLYLHFVFEDQEAGFREMLRALARDHAFISHDEAVRRLWSGRIDRPYVTFSFDDGVKNCVRAARILEEFGASGCFYVCPDVVGAGPEARAAFSAERLHKPPLAFMDWDDLEGLLQRGHEIGSHTMSHPNVAELTPRQVQDELGRSREVLQRRLGEVRHFAWPYGWFRCFSAEAARAAFDAGYASCASAERGCHTTGTPDRRALCIRRNHVVASWPARHVESLMLLNTLRASRQRDGWPQPWPAA